MKMIRNYNQFTKSKSIKENWSPEMPGLDQVTSGPSDTMGLEDETSFSTDLDNEFNSDIPEHEEEEVIEGSCQDNLRSAIDDLDSAIGNCMEFEAGEEGEAQHEEHEREIYGRMLELTSELKGLMSELTGEEALEDENAELSENCECTTCNCANNCKCECCCN